MWSPDNSLEDSDQDYNQQPSCLKLLLLWGCCCIHSPGDCCLSASGKRQCIPALLLARSKKWSWHWLEAPLSEICILHGWSIESASVQACVLSLLSTDPGNCSTVHCYTICGHYGNRFPWKWLVPCVTDSCLQYWWCSWPRTFSHVLCIFPTLGMAVYCGSVPCCHRHLFECTTAYAEWQARMDGDFCCSTWSFHWPPYDITHLLCFIWGTWAC